VSGSLVDTSLSSNRRNLLLLTGKFGWAGRTRWNISRAAMRRATLISHYDDEHGALRRHPAAGRMGWTAGAGLEYALWNHIIIGVEYDYCEVQRRHPRPGPTALGPAGTQVRAAVWISRRFMARLSFKFGGARPEPIPTK